jgi:hypothetical protein
MLVRNPENRFDAEQLHDVNKFVFSIYFLLIVFLIKSTSSKIDRLCDCFLKIDHNSIV